KIKKMADDTKPGGEIPSAPPMGANPAATPHVKPVPAGVSEVATARAAAATAAQPRPAAAPRPPAAPIPDLAGKTTSPASTGGAAAKAAAPAAAPKTGAKAAATTGRD